MTRNCVSRWQKAGYPGWPPPCDVPMPISTTMDTSCPWIIAITRELEGKPTMIYPHLVNGRYVDVGVEAREEAPTVEDAECPVLLERSAPPVPLPVIGGHVHRTPDGSIQSEVLAVPVEAFAGRTDGSVVVSPYLARCLRSVALGCVWWKRIPPSIYVWTGTISFLDERQLVDDKDKAQWCLGCCFSLLTTALFRFRPLLALSALSMRPLPLSVSRCLARTVCIPPVRKKTSSRSCSSQTLAR